MSEEVQQARTAVPRALMASVFINGLLGFGMLVTVLFCIGSIPNALTPSTGFTFIEVFQESLGTNGFATGLTALLLVLFIFCAVAVLAATSRVTWAFARDDGLPGSSWIKKVCHRRPPPPHSVVQRKLTTSRRLSRGRTCRCTLLACPQLFLCSWVSSTSAPRLHSMLSCRSSSPHTSDPT
jgi:Amino acid permease